MAEIDYGFMKTFPHLGYDDAVKGITAALQAEGFGVLTEIDVRATLQKKLDVDFRPYTILGACNPKLAHRALSAEPHIGLLLPCNVVVQAAEGGGSVVSILAPSAMFAMVRRDDIREVAADAEARLRRALDAVG